ncbi:MAG: universal stress protein [Aliarcobacter sp.]
MSYVLCCVDGKNYSQSACDYAVMISNNMNLPLKFLNIIEHSSKVEKLNLSGNIKLGEKDDLLQEYTNEEATKSQCAIKTGKELLNTLKQKALQTCKNEITILQVHGDVIETILDFEKEISVLVIGIKSHEEHIIGENVKDIIRTIHKPVLLVNREFIEPKKLLIAYNGSNESKKLLNETSKKPIFKNIKRDIVNINADKILSAKLLNEAKEIFAKQNIEIDTSVLSGEPKEAIYNYFEQNNCDILAMGAFGHSRLKEFIFGSFTSEMLRKIKKPILLFR